MADDQPSNDEPTPDPEGTETQPEAPAGEQQDAVEEAASEQVPVPEEDVAAAEEPSSTEESAPAAEEPAAPAAEEPAAPAAEEPAAPAAEEPAATEADDDEPEQPRAKPAIPGADLEVDLVLEGEREERAAGEYAYDDEEGAADSGEEDVVTIEPVVATIDLAAGARYNATGKRKTSVARVILKPGTGAYLINGKPLDTYFPRSTLQRQIRQPLEAVGYEEKMDVVARMHGGGVSAQAGALRHGISRALIDADPNLRGELKRRGFLTRDPRVKERKKAGLKKARKRPQFSKR
jgi:small subunit ribosomal protein S9